jgi:hypothetical protein
MNPPLTVLRCDCPDTLQDLLLGKMFRAHVGGLANQTSDPMRWTCTSCGVHRETPHANDITPDIQTGNRDRDNPSVASGS